jgi:hypothetical protein
MNTSQLQITQHQDPKIESIDPEESTEQQNLSPTEPSALFPPIVNEQKAPIPVWFVLGGIATITIGLVTYLAYQTTPVAIPQPAQTNRESKTSVTPIWVNRNITTKAFSKDGELQQAEIQINFRSPAKIVAGSDREKEIDTVLVQSVRDRVASYLAASIPKEQKQLTNSIQTTINNGLKKQGIDTELSSLSIFVEPKTDEIVQAAKIQAMANGIIAKSLTPIVVQNNAISRWKGEGSYNNSAITPIVPMTTQQVKPIVKK